MGADVTVTPESVTVTGPASAGLHGVTVNMRDISDTMPTLAAIAPFASSPVRIEDVYNTRVAHGKFTSAQLYADTAALTPAAP